MSVKILMIEDSRDWNDGFMADNQLLMHSPVKISVVNKSKVEFMKLVNWSQCKWQNNIKQLQPQKDN